MTKLRVVVIGNGMTGLKFVEELLAAAPRDMDIAVIGEEREPAYNRVLLSQLLSGDIGPEACEMRAASWYSGQGVTLRLGTRVTNFNSRERVITLHDGSTLAFDVCVLATGSQPIRLNVPGVALPGVHVFRTLGDAGSLQAIASRGEMTVVIGGGLLGIEAAYGLKRSGAHVTLVHLMDRLMERQLDARAAAILRRALENLGIEVRLAAETGSFDGHGRVEAVTLKPDIHIPASAVVMAIGIKPNTALAASGALKVNRGIAVDNHMRTSNPNVFAIGECAEHDGLCYGLVEPCYEQAKVAAHIIAGRAEATFSPVALTTNLKVSGVPVFSAGDFEGHGLEHIVLHDAASGMYRKFVIAENRLKGAVLVGDTADALWYRDLIRSGSDISRLRSTLAFGRFEKEAA